MKIVDIDDFVTILDSLRGHFIIQRNLILDSIKYHFPYYKRKINAIDAEIDKIDALLGFLIINKMY